MLKTLWFKLQEWSWWGLWGAVWTAIASYPIRMYFHKEYFERASLLQNLVFLFCLWAVVTGLIVRPICEQREANEEND